MRFLCVALLLLAWASSAWALDVTTPAERQLSLLEYVAKRDDLSKVDKTAWDKALRSVFGGAAMKDGTDEGVTVAKSVVSAAIFFDVEPKRAARAAYDAYHDTYRWVPPPIAINYQILVLQGRKPKADPRQLAFDFPRYFNEEIAPDLASWWDEMLTADKIPALEKANVEAALAATRTLMRPMLRERLWLLVELDARREWLSQSGKNKELQEVTRALAALKDELHRDFKGVGKTPVIGNEQAPAYERYHALCKELGVSAKARPAYAGPVKPPPAEPKPQAKLEPKSEPKPPPAKPESLASPRPAPATDPTPPLKVAPQEMMVDAKEAEVRERKAEKDAGHVSPPLSGDPLVPVFPTWERVLNTTVDRWVGTPYLWGGVDHRGIDCSGFSRQVFREAFSVELPRNSRAQFATGQKVEQREMKAGDLVFFDTMDRGTVTHVGVYLGNGLFAHASSSKGVTRAELSKKYHQRAFWGSRRILKS